jgi:hypothetical protein
MLKLATVLACAALSISIAMAQQRSNIQHPPNSRRITADQFRALKINTLYSEAVRRLGCGGKQISRIATPIRDAIAKIARQTRL